MYEEGYLDDAYEFVKDVDWPPKGKKSKRKKFKYSKAERLKFKAYANKLRFPPTISSIIKKKASTRL